LEIEQNAQTAEREEGGEEEEPREMMRTRGTCSPRAKDAKVTFLLD
jgi:hypothetical protein